MGSSFRPEPRAWHDDHEAFRRRAQEQSAEWLRQLMAQKASAGIGTTSVGGGAFGGSSMFSGTPQVSVVPGAAGQQEGSAALRQMVMPGLQADASRSIPLRDEWNRIKLGVGGGLPGLIYSTLQNMRPNKYIQEASQPYREQGAAEYYGSTVQEVPAARAARDAADKATTSPYADAVIGSTFGLPAGADQGMLMGMLESVPEMATDLLGMLSRLPGAETAASALDRAFHVSESKRWLGKMREAARNQLPVQSRENFEIGTTAGKFVGMAAPMAASWKVAGAVMGGATGYANSGAIIMRGTVQGALAANIATAGKDLPMWEADTDPNASMVDQVVSQVMGTRVGQTVFGAATAGLLSAVSLKLANSPATRAPKGPDIDWGPNNGRPQPRPSGPVTDAEWAFEAEAIGGPRVGQRRLGSGELGTPVESAPVEPQFRTVDPGAPTSQMTPQQIEALASMQEARLEAARAADDGLDAYGFAVKDLEQDVQTLRDLSQGHVDSAPFAPSRVVETKPLSYDMDNSVLFKVQGTPKIDRAMAADRMTQIDWRLSEMARREGQTAPSYAGVLNSQADLYYASQSVRDLMKQKAELEAIGPQGYAGEPGDPLRQIPFDYQYNNQDVSPEVLEWDIQQMYSNIPGLKEFVQLRDERDKLAQEAGFDPLITFEELNKIKRESVMTPARRLVNQMPGAIRDEDGLPKMIFHGTGVGFEQPDISKTSPGGLTGRGLYTADDPYVSGGNPALNSYDNASEYAFMRASDIQFDYGYNQQRLDGLKQERTELLAAGAPNVNQLATINDEIARLEDRIGLEPVPAPNLHAYYAFPRKTLRAFDRLSSANVDEADAILQHAFHKIEASGFEQANTRSVSFIMSPQQVRSGYDEIKQEWETVKQTIDQPRDIKGAWGNMHSIMKQLEYITGGTDVWTDTLLDLGYDAIHNEGGFSNSTRPYNAYNIINPEILVPAYAGDKFFKQHGEFLAAQLTKQATVMSSPTMPDAAAGSEVTDTDVGSASLGTNPAGVSIIRNLGDPAKVNEDILAGRMTAQGIIPRYYQFVQRNGSIDMLVSTLKPITPEMAESYTQYGLFEGMRVQSVASGFAKEGIANSNVYLNAKGNPVITWRKPDAKPKGVRSDGSFVFQAPATKVENVLMSPFAQTVADVSELWESFKPYAEQKLGYLAGEVLANGEVLDAPIQYWDERGRAELPRLVNEFLDINKVTDPVDRAAITAGFDLKLIDTYRELSGEVGPLAEALAEQATLDVAQALEEGRLVGTTIFDLAAVRGFTAFPENGSIGYALNDRNSGAVFHFEDEDAAAAFLTNYHREIPEEDFPTVVPSQVMHDAPVQSSSESRPPESDIIGRAEEGFAQADADIAEELAEEAASGEFSGNWEATTPPPTGGNPIGSAVTGGGGSAQPPSVGGSGSGNGGPPSNVANLAKHRGDIEGQFLGFFARHTQPVRTTMAKIENALYQLGETELRPFHWYSEIVTKRNEAHIEAYPYHQELADAFNQIGSAKIRKGYVWDVLEAEGTDRDIAAAKYNFTDREVQAVEQMEQSILRLLDDPLRPGRAQNVWSALRRYVAIVRVQQLSQVQGAFGKPGDYPSISWFVEHASDGNLVFVNPDANDILHTVVKAYTFEKHVREAWDAGEAAATRMRDLQYGDERPLHQVGDYFLNWMGVIRRGYEPGTDFVLDAVHSMLNKFVPLTKREASNIINGGLSAVHRSVMGWRPATVLRDATQPWTAAPFTGWGNMASVYRDLANPENLPDIWQRAERIGTVIPGVPPIEGSGIMSDLHAGSGTMRTSVRGAAIRELLAVSRGFVRDLVPPKLRTISGTKIDPMWLYTKNGEMNRVITGEAAYRRFNEAYVDWQAAMTDAISSGNIQAAPSLTTFVDNLADGLEPAVRRIIRDHLSGNRTEDAAAAFAREITDMTQFRYGVSEQAPGGRTHTARVAWQFGNFSINSINTMSRALRNGSAIQNAKVLGWHSAVASALVSASAVTGWSFYNWLWLNPAFKGGPYVEAIGKAFAPVALLFDVMGNRNVSRTERTAAQQALDPRNLVGAAQMLNPFDGARAGAGAIMNAVGSDAPAENLARWLVTGDRTGDAWQYKNRLRDPNPGDTSRTDYERGLTRFAPPDPDSALTGGLGGGGGFQ